LRQIGLNLSLSLTGLSWNINRFGVSPSPVTTTKGSWSLGP
jgi:hypothetical protein